MDSFQIRREQGRGGRSPITWRPETSVEGGTRFWPSGLRVYPILAIAVIYNDEILLIRTRALRNEVRVLYILLFGVRYVQGVTVETLECLRKYVFINLLLPQLSRRQYLRYIF